MRERTLCGGASHHLPVLTPGHRASAEGGSVSTARGGQMQTIQQGRHAGLIGNAKHRTVVNRCATSPPGVCALATGHFVVRPTPPCPTHAPPFQSQGDLGSVKSLHVAIVSFSNCTVSSTTRFHPSIKSRRSPHDHTYARDEQKKELAAGRCE